MSFLNLTYKSPARDVDDNMNYNSDGTINVKFTMFSLKNILLENISKIDTILRNIDNITDINIINNSIEIVLNNSDVEKNLIDANILTNGINEDDTDYLMDIETEIETNSDRLQMLRLLTSQNILPLDPESDSE